MRIPRPVVAALLVLALAGCTPDAPPSYDTDDSVTPVESVTPDPEETTAAPADPTGLSDDDYANIAESISSGNTAALEGYLSGSVNFIIAASECCGPVTPIEAISNLDYLASATGPWSYPVPEMVVDGYREGFYVDYFPADAFVMASSGEDPFIVSFDIDGDHIVGIFISAGESLLYP